LEIAMTLIANRFLIVAALVASALLAACGNTFSRDDFTKAVVGKSEQEVTTAVGKPSSVKETDAEHATWTYSHQTFDLNNQNRIDSTTTVIFEGPAGKRHATKVDFS
jgi:outer membrane biogenesis lipoprotein LolB